MKKVIGIKLVCLQALLLFVVACSGPSGQEAKLVGRWQTTEMLAKAMVEYHADHSLTLSAATLFGSFNASGTWRLDGDEIIHEDIQSTTASNSMLSAGESGGRSKIVQLDDSKLVVRQFKNGDWSSETITYQRLR